LNRWNLGGTGFYGMKKGLAIARRDVSMSDLSTKSKRTERGKKGEREKKGGEKGEKKKKKGGKHRRNHVLISGAKTKKEWCGKIKVSRG